MSALTLLALLTATTMLAAAESPGELRWAGDSEGGAPFGEADPARPDEVIGLDVEVENLIARGLGRTPRFVPIAFTSIDQSIERGDAEIGLSGVEDTPARRAASIRPSEGAARDIRAFVTSDRF